MKMLINRADARIRVFAPEIQRIEHSNEHGLFVEYRIGGDFSGYRYSQLDWELWDEDALALQAASEFVLSKFTSYEGHDGVYRRRDEQPITLADIRKAMEEAYLAGLNCKLHIQEH